MLSDVVTVEDEDEDEVVVDEDADVAACRLQLSSGSVVRARGRLVAITSINLCEPGYTEREQRHISSNARAAAHEQEKGGERTRSRPSFSTVNSMLQSTAPPFLFPIHTHHGRHRYQQHAAHAQRVMSEGARGWARKKGNRAHPIEAELCCYRIERGQQLRTCPFLSTTTTSAPATDITTHRARKQQRTSSSRARAAAAAHEQQQQQRTSSSARAAAAAHEQQQQRTSSSSRSARAAAAAAHEQQRTSTSARVAAREQQRVSGSARAAAHERRSC